MEFEKSKLPIIPFASHNVNSIITRITDLRSVYEFVKESKLHFSALSKFSDHTEGKKFDDLKMDALTEDENAVSPLKRRKIMYASCWYNGGETLHMWDIYGKENRQFAIQIDINELLTLGFHSGNFQFKSDVFEAYKNITKSILEFKPSALYHGHVNYVDLKSNIESKNLFIGRFKDQAFNHEKEWRILLRQNYEAAPLIDLDDLKCHFFGADFSQLQKNIIVSPYANAMQVEELKKEFNSLQNIDIKPSIFTELFQ
jgi:hypothetical protein